MNTAINHKGTLAVTGPWSPDYDLPVMGRTVWVSTNKHPWDERYADFTTEPAGETATEQFWRLKSGLGGVISFRSGLRGVYETGAAIRMPRLVKYQAKPWRYHRGAWDRHYQADEIEGDAIKAMASLYVLGSMVRQ